MKLFLRSVVFLVIASFTPVAFAQTISYINNGSSASFDDPANFTTAISSGTTTPGPSNLLGIFPGFTATPSPSTGLILLNPGGSSTITLTTNNPQSVQGLLVSGNFDSTSNSGTTVSLTIGGGNALTIGPAGFALVGSTTMTFTGNLVQSAGLFEVGSNNNNIDAAQTTGPGTLILGAGSANLDSANTSILVGNGTLGTINQTSGSILTTGATVTIGENASGNGTLSVSGGSTLNIGTTGAPVATSYNVAVGSNGGTGNLSISDTSTLNASNAQTNFTIGGTGVGTVTQNGTSTVNIGGTSSFLTIGENSGNSTSGVGTYNLESGSLNVSGLNFNLGEGTGSTGNLIQSGGALVVAQGTAFTVGAGGSATYSISAGTADLQSGVLVGVGSTASVIQTGGTVTTENNLSELGVTGGTGFYDLEEGTASFGGSMSVSAGSALNVSGGTFNLGTVASSTLTVLNGGQVNQTGGTVTIDPTHAQTLDLSTFGASYNLNGGILQVGTGGLLGTTGDGTLNFGGGTLQVTTTGNFTEALDGTLTGGGATIDAATTAGVTNVTMAGNLSGTGGITFAGGANTVFHFSGTNTYTGVTDIASGTLDATQVDISNSSSLVMGATGVLNLNLENGGFAYAGTLGGTGSLKLNFANAGDAFVLLKSGSYTGLITLGANGTAGKLQVYNGNFGNINDNGTASDVVIGGTSLATLPAGATAPVSGIVTIGNATYTGTTTINSGFTLNANSLVGPVTNLGSFYASSTGALTNMGFVSVPTSSAIGSALTINGALNSSGPNSVLGFRASGATSLADLIHSTGATTIDNLTQFRIIGTGTIAIPIPILTADGGLTVDPAALHDISGSLLFDATLTQNGNSIDLTAIQGATAAFATTPNETAVAGSLDPAITNFSALPASQQAALSPMLQTLNSFTSGSQIAAALEQLSPESLQYARNIAFENSTFLAQRMNGVDADLRAGYGGLDTNAISVITPGFESGTGRSLQSLLAYNDPSFHSAAPNGVNYYPGSDESISSSSESSSHSSKAPSWDSSSQVISDSPNPYLAHQDPNAAGAPSMSEFIGGDVILADLNQNQSASNAPSSKAHYTAGDATAGISFRMTSHLATGVLFDYNHTDAKTDSAGSKTTVDSYSPGVFATYFDRGFYANGLFSFGYNNYDNSRDIPLIGKTASSSPSGQQYVGDLDVGYDFHPNKNWILGPTLGLTYTHLDIDSFTETGAPGADLAVDSQSVDSLRSRFGGHAIFQTNTGDVLLQPNITAMWQHEYLASGSGITSSFNDFSSNPFTIQTASPSRDSALIGVGLTATLNNSMALYLNYLADVGADDYFAQSVVGGFKARF
jgi:fibronectin-binding autotransporter adhesin